MCFWVEVYMFFVLHDYYDINIILFVFVGLERKVFAIPQLSPMGMSFQPLRFTNGPFFYLKIGLDIGHVFEKGLIFDEFVLWFTYTQWRSHWGVKGGRVPPLTMNNLPKIGKKKDKIRKNWGKKRKLQEEEAKIGKVLSLCPSWQIGLATLLPIGCQKVFMHVNLHGKKVLIGLKRALQDANGWDIGCRFVSSLV